MGSSSGCGPRAPRSSLPRTASGGGCERDLHDGAQQALAGLAMAIGLARGASAESGLAGAQDRVRAALADVRTLAHAT